MGGPARSWVSVICETVRFHYLFSGGGGGTRKRVTVCSSAAISTGLDRCASMPASLLFFTSSRKAFAVNACGLSELDLVRILL